MATVVERWNVQPAHGWLRGRRPEKSVVFNEEIGLWCAYGHAEVHTILNDPKTYSSRTAHLAAVTVDPKFSEGDMSQMDPPDQTRYRKLVSHAFTPKVITALEPRIDRLTHDLIDAIDGRSEFDLISEVAYPLPVIVISELLGIPSSDRELFKKAAFSVIDSLSGFAFISGGDEAEREINTAIDALQPMYDYMLDQVLERRSHPREDLLSHLATAEHEGQRLTDNEIVNIANILLITGHITTTMLLGNTVACLDNDPGQFARVRADRSLVPSALEEGLRVLTPSAALSRATTRDVELGGEYIPAGQMILAWVGAANRDPVTFAAPDHYDASRNPNPHLSFGRGVHFCIGAPLARLEGRIALNNILDRLPSVATDPGNPPVFFPSPDMIGVRSLPLRVG